MWKEVRRTRKKEILSSHHVESSRPSLTTVSLRARQSTIYVITFKYNLLQTLRRMFFFGDLSCFFNRCCWVTLSNSTRIILVNDLNCFVNRCCWVILSNSTRIILVNEQKAQIATQRRLPTAFTKLRSHLLSNLKDMGRFFKIFFLCRY